VLILMTEISDGSEEWATVLRIKSIIEVDLENNITRDYIVLVGLLCWALQRIRARDAPQCFMDIRSRLSKTPIEAILSQSSASDFCELAEKCKSENSFEALVSIRNALAHGDDRTVLPFNEGGVLLGYVVTCECPKYIKKDKWEPVKITLRAQGMRDIIAYLSNEFKCAAKN
jgi:hypothetical protein